MSIAKNQKPHQMKAVAYCRAACAAQTGVNPSLEAQKRHICEMAKKLNVKIVKWCEVVGKSDNQSEALKEAYGYCKSRHICYLFVASPDRLSRSSTDYNDWGQKFWGIGVVVQSAKTFNKSLEALVAERAN